MRRKLGTEIERHKKCHANIIGKEMAGYSAKDVDIRNYAKYVLREETIFEKRDLLTAAKNKLSIKAKDVILLEK